MLFIMWQGDFEVEMYLESSKTQIQPDPAKLADDVEAILADLADVEEVVPADLPDVVEAIIDDGIVDSIIDRLEAEAELTQDLNTNLGVVHQPLKKSGRRAKPLL
ncbi:hypothetical protein HAX54_028765 [Datura stramonium]|uniref:Uncharacterized protein n=1 Tax=Datura stramonium TaxID=4076 RepID=A0ABS8S9T8_DATST|nr:hypothetical protein [Datura stramonium]